MSFIQQLQQYTPKGQNNITMADLNSLVKQVNKTIECGPECQKDKKLRRLKYKYENEKTRLSRAPYDLDVSRKRYFTYAFGDQYYDNFMRNKAEKEISKLCNKLALDHQYNMKTIKDNVQEYNNVLENKENLLLLKENYQSENKELKKKIDDMIQEKNLNSRKVVYETHEIDKLTYYNTQLIKTYWFFVLIFLLTFFFKHMYMEPKNFVVVLFLLVFPFFIYWVTWTFLNIFELISNFIPKNMYIYDPVL
jgi:hypothetical protein